MATAYDCKFIESSVTINHNVVSILRAFLRPPSNLTILLNVFFF